MFTADWVKDCPLCLWFGFKLWEEGGGKSKCCVGQFYNVGNQTLSLKTCAVVKCCSALSKLATHAQTESFLRIANFSSILPRNLFMLSDLFWANTCSTAYDYWLIPYVTLQFCIYYTSISFSETVQSFLWMQSSPVPHPCIISLHSNNFVLKAAASRASE